MSNLNPCKKDQDRAIEKVCDKLGGEYYGPSGKSIQINTGKSFKIFLEYDKNSESLKEIKIPDSIKLYQAMVFVELEHLGNDIKYPIRILINVTLKRCDMSGTIKVSCDGELKVESIMEAMRIFSNDIIIKVYDKYIDKWNINVS